MRVALDMDDERAWIVARCEEKYRSGHSWDRIFADRALKGFDWRRDVTIWEMRLGELQAKEGRDDREPDGSQADPEALGAL